MTGLGLKTHDDTHGSDWYWGFRKWYEYAKREYIGPVRDHPPEWVTLYYDPDIDFNVKVLDARSWLMTCWFLIPHDLKMASILYEGGKNRFLVENGEGGAFFTGVSGSRRHDAYATSIGISLARELGDMALYGKLRNWVDRTYRPEFDADRGEFYYTFGFEEPFPRGQYNAWIMPSFVGGEKTWWNLFNRPNFDKFHQPAVYGVDFSQIGLSQAYYDSAHGALYVSTILGDPAAAGRETRFTIGHLRNPDTISVFMDNQPYDGWSIRGGEMEITTTAGRHSFVINTR